MVCGDLLGLANGLLIECCCPHCGGTHFKKSGYCGNGTRRYRCLDCGKAFSLLTGTVFDAHKILIETFGLTEEVYTTKATHNLSDDDNPMEPVNAVHRSLKRFMRQHPAYDRDDLQDWLNLFRFIYTNRGISLDDKVKKFLRMAVLTRKVIRFREVLPKRRKNDGLSGHLCKPRFL